MSGPGDGFRDIHLRYTAASGLVLLGLAAGLLGYAYFVRDYWHLIPSGVGVALAVVFAGLGVHRLVGRKVVLSLTADRIVDHRYGKAVPWADVRGVRRHDLVVNGVRTNATVYLRTASGEVDFPVESLTRSAEAVVAVIEERVRAAA